MAEGANVLASADARAEPYCFCTYFDRNYLAIGLALHASLLRSCRRPFVLWILCFDDETYDVLGRLALPNVRLISRQEFESGDPEAAATQATRSAVEYYWTCTPCLPRYVLRQNPDVETITYLDADLFFFRDPAPIYDELGDGSVLIIEHRYAPQLSQYTHFDQCGRFNVGFLAFRRDGEGLACLEWWRARCIEWCYNRFEDGKFGDQKYLDEWPGRFRGVKVLKHKGGGLAPWSLPQYATAATSRGVLIDGEPLIFYHFHGFRQMTGNVVIGTHDLYQELFTPSHLRLLYFPYWRALRSVQRRVTAMGRACSIPAGVPAAGESVMAALLQGKFLLAKPATVGILIWQIAKRARARKRRREQRRLTAFRLRREGLFAYSQGQPVQTRRLLLGAVCEEPWLLVDRTVVSVLLETVLGSAAMSSGRRFLSALRRGIRRR